MLIGNWRLKLKYLSPRGIRVLVAVGAFFIFGQAQAGTARRAPSKRPVEIISAWRGPAAVTTPKPSPTPLPQVKKVAPSVSNQVPVSSNSTSQLEASLRQRIAKNDKDVSARISLAELCQKRNDFGCMVDSLRPASDNLTRKGMLLLATGYRGKKETLNEVRVLELLLAQNQKDYYVQDLVGETYVTLGKKPEAVEKFQESRKLNGKFLPAYKDLLALYEATDENYEATNLLNDMIRTFGPRSEFYNELCKLYSNDGYLEKSAQVCRLAISKQPQQAQNHMYYAQTLWDLEKKDDALRILKQAAKKFQTSEDVQNAAGEMTYNVGDFISSFKFFAQCTKGHPKSSKCQLGYAKSAFELQKYSEALDGFSALCKLDNSSMGEFRKANATLRQKNEYVWANKFDSAINHCSAITN